MADERNNVRIALSRSRIYAFLTEAFIRLPDEDFMKTIKSRDTLDFLNYYKNVNQKEMTNGINIILAFMEGIETEKQPEMIEALAIDRTALIRSAGKNKLKAPYEGLYKKREQAHTIILSVKKFYKQIGKLPHSYANDSLDFMCTELDFMRQLCLLEADADNNRDKIRTLEKEFLNQHLGSWIADYCKAAGKFAKTDFYKGLLLFLEGFITLESNTDQN